MSTVIECMSCCSVSHGRTSFQKDDDIYSCVVQTVCMNQSRFLNFFFGLRIPLHLKILVDAKEPLLMWIDICGLRNWNKIF